MANFIIGTSVVDHPNQWTIIKLWNYKRFHQNMAFIQGHISKREIEHEVHNLPSCIKTGYAH